MIQKISNRFYFYIRRLRRLFNRDINTTLQDISHEDTFDVNGRLIKRVYIVRVDGRRKLTNDLIKNLFWQYTTHYDRVVGEVNQENRDRALNSILNGGEYIPMKIEEHPDYLKNK